MLLTPKKSKRMEKYNEWCDAIAQNKLRDKTYKRDESGLKYAKKHGITYVYVDAVTGEIMQFGYYKNREMCDVQWNGLFPKRYMVAMKTQEYDEMTNSSFASKSSC